jgi:hypothetical protein
MIIIAIAARFRWKMHHMDVCIAFLNDDNPDDVYMTQSPDIYNQDKRTWFVWYINPFMV